MPRYRTAYPPEFRRQMVDLVRSGRTPEELAREFFAAYTFSTQTTLNLSSESTITSCGPTARVLGACGSCSRCCLRGSPRKRAIVTIPPRTVRPNWSASPIVA